MYILHTLTPDTVTHTEHSLSVLPSSVFRAEWPPPRETTQRGLHGTGERTVVTVVTVLLIPLTR